MQETEIREACKDDLPYMIKMIAEDELGISRDKYTEPIMQCYEDAFKEITADKNSVLLVICVNGIAGLQDWICRSLSRQLS